MNDDLVAFLKARLGEDEEVAKAATAGIVTQLQLVPWLAEQLQITRTRQDRLASPAGAGEGAPLGFHIGAQRAYQSLHNTLGGWVRILYDPGEFMPADRQRASASYFRAATLARLLPRFIDRPVSASNIRNWQAEGRAIRVGRDADGWTTYHCGDVIAVACSTPKRDRKAG